MDIQFANNNLYIMNNNKKNNNLAKYGLTLISIQYTCSCVKYLLLYIFYTIYYHCTRKNL